VNVRLVAVGSDVWDWGESLIPAVDSSAVDRVVSRWMTYHGVQEGDRIQACYVQVDGMDHPAQVWVVVGLSGLVLSISQPPVGVSLPGGPAGVYVAPKRP